MTDNTPDILDQLWHDLEPRQVPLPAILAAGRATRRRKRIAAVAGAAIATALVLTAGVTISQELSNGTDQQTATSGPTNVL